MTGACGILYVQDDRTGAAPGLSSGSGGRAERLGLGRELREALRRHLEVEDLGDHLAPAVEEVAPAVVHRESALGHLASRRSEKAEVAAVVQLPHDAFLRKQGRVADR